MFSEEGFKEAIKLLAKLNNLPLDRAGYLMTLIGDTPEMAEDGKIIVRDDQDNEIARVDYPSRED